MMEKEPKPSDQALVRRLGFLTARIAEWQQMADQTVMELHERGVIENLPTRLRPENPDTAA